MTHSFVVLARCADGSLYTTVTADPDLEVDRINVGDGNPYTRARLPVFLAYAEEYMNEKDALKRAAAVKRLSRGDKETIIAGACVGAVELGYAV